MLRTSMIMKTAAWVAWVVLGAHAAAQADVVYSYNPGPFGDAVTAAGPTGTPNWTYSYAGAGATFGINSNIPDAHGGNGSLWMHGDAPGTAYEGDTQYDTGQPLGLLSEMTALSYEWYRDSSSTTWDIRAPALAIYISNGDDATAGYLVYEPTYTEYPGNAPVPTNVWHNSDIVALDGNMWSTPNLPSTPNYYNSHLSSWQNDPRLAGYSVYSITAFYGSGWEGSFTGAVDYITIGFNEQDTTYDFEVGAVPEPASVVSVLTACGLGLAAAAHRRRAR